MKEIWQGKRLRLWVSEDDENPSAVEIRLTGDGRGASVRITVDGDSLVVMSPDETEHLSAFTIRTKE